MLSTYGVKGGYLIALTLQSTILAVLLRLASKSGFAPSVAVFFEELVKLVVCYIVLFAYFVRSKASLTELSLAGWMAYVEAQVCPTPGYLISMALPAVLYAVQKILSFVAASHLSPAVCQVLYQGKTLTTAFFAYLILKKDFSKRQKLSLLLLATGVALVEVSGMQDHAAGGSSGSSHGSESSGFVVGTIAILVACVTSGFSGVYIEYMLKHRSSGVEEPQTVWARNIQLSTFGTLSAALSALVTDRAQIQAHGSFFGFTPMVWSVILTSSLGGILVALVLKHADNILKTFATAVAIVLTCVVSIVFLDFQISFTFACGTILVVGAAHLYSTKAPDPRHSPTTTFSPRDEIELGKSIDFPAE